MPNSYYIIKLAGGTDPGSFGPFETQKIRDDAARTIFKAIDAEDTLFYIDIISGILAVGAYSGAFGEAARSRGKR